MWPLAPQACKCVEGMQVLAFAIIYVDFHATYDCVRLRASAQLACCKTLGSSKLEEEPKA